ncbi:PREDICTED: tryptophan aminotransferase-related protein 2-like [Lupinus angustifolius]|uniref:tryptophan aminotransferase-related protein 2-like n=1 Tax=Lupinus angustifolius TaxID=3871 RepID=UPI00092E96E9|nr:PREDICTED: tryptophan aminotransferase-related protein 2-like [Lupinus angustifolius]XP_019463891.1 PREDICTED: tryptophan aminotransferase-related protein 2-like [Lupinus angustifolius]
MSKFPTMFSMRHFLVVSLALNVSLILRIVYDNEDNPSKYMGLKKTTTSEYDAKSRREVPIIHHLRLSTSTLANSSTCSDHPEDRDRIVNLDHGDPKMYEKFWRKMGDKTTITIPGWQSISYFSDITNICWFLEPEFAKEVVRLHNVVGNAVTKGRYIVVGTGSSQLILAAFYALSPPDAPEPINVLSASPYYSSYPSMTDFQKSGLYKWGGDAKSFDKDGPYIELVTSPNNPDGHTRQPVVNRSDGILIHDLAYYWPHYTPISTTSDHDITLFTVSKSTGHAGMRIGWALVKDQEVAKGMTKFIELNTIGVSKDSQLRAAKVLKLVSDSTEQEKSQELSFFKYSYEIMEQRWKQLRASVEANGLFTLPNFPPEFCTFFNKETENLPAFAWMKCEKDIEDCQSFLGEHRILSRGGKHFGVSQRYVRVSMLDTDENFNLFINRLSAMQI